MDRLKLVWTISVVAITIVVAALLFMSTYETELMQRYALGVVALGLLLASVVHLPAKLDMKLTIGYASAVGLLCLANSEPGKVVLNALIAAAALAAWRVTAWVLQGFRQNR